LGVDYHYSPGVRHLQLCWVVRNKYEVEGPSTNHPNALSAQAKTRFFSHHL
jgi:hypothetical protein